MEKATWLEVSLIVDGEMAEATAEVLGRFAPNGVVIETTAVGANEDDTEGYPVGPLRVFAFLPADDRLEDTRRHLDEALWYLGRIRPLPVAQYRFVEEVNWVEAWKQHYHPIAIGKKLMIVPAWLVNPKPERVAVRIDPGMAFGTGAHPTTQLCLEFIEDVVQQGQVVIDVGCGTAILAVAALLLGADHALGVDTDPEAVTAAAENAAANKVSERLELAQGSLAEILAGKFTLRQAPLVCANILAPVLIHMLDGGLGDLVTPGGALILSGILAEQAQSVNAAANKHGLSLVESRQIGDWVALRFTVQG